MKRATVSVDFDLLTAFREAGICFSYDWQEVADGRGWISDVERISITPPVRIEGPSAFYAGPYSPNAWTIPSGLCSMGACSYSHSPLPAGMVVGRYCSIAKGLRILDFSHPTDWISSSIAFFRPEDVAYVSPLHGAIDALIAKEGAKGRLAFDPKRGKPFPIIGNDVWIGEDVSIALGVSVGDGAIVAAHSVLTRDVPPYSVVGGVPARVMKMRFEAPIVALLMRSEWWNYAFYSLGDLDPRNPVTFAAEVIARVAAGALEPWAPAAIELGDGGPESDVP